MIHRHLPLTPEWVLWPEPWVWALLLLLLLPLLWVWWLRRRRASVRFSGLAELRAAGSVWPRRVRLILPMLRTAALACLIVAIARPQRPDESSQVYAEGIAIQMVVDTSSSMWEDDLSPRGQRLTRLDVVKDVFKRFVDGDGDLPGRPNDLIGMIRFARYADSICPLTLDHAALLDILDQTNLVRRRDEDGTAVGDALAMAVNRLKDLKRTSGSGEQYTITSRVIILLTDGEDNASTIMPAQAGDLAATFGIKVYTILAGRTGASGHVLKHVADVTGGKYFQASNKAALDEVYAEIDKLERTKTEERRFVSYGELSHAWLVAAFALVGLQTILGATRLRKIP